MPWGEASGGNLGQRLLRSRVDELEVENLVLRVLLAEANDRIDGPLHDRIADALDIYGEDRAHG